MPYKDPEKRRARDRKHQRTLSEETKEKRRIHSREYRRRLGELYLAKHRYNYTKNSDRERPSGSWVTNRNHTFRHGIWSRKDGYYSVR